MSALVNLNARSFSDEPSGPVTEADLLRAISACADGDTDFGGWGDFSDTLPVPVLTHYACTSGHAQPFKPEHADRRFWPVPQRQPAECCTEIGSDTAAAAPSPHGLARLFTSYPRIATFALICFLLLCMGLADTNDIEAEHEQLADNAAEVQP